MSAPRKTLQEYLQWAALKPRTNDWSALVAYDRDKCNQVLQQEYIGKYERASVMPPINEAYRSSENTWNWLLDYVTDAPRLSFENDPGNESAEINIRMAVIGGKDVTLDDASGFAQISRISSLDPLDHPQLLAERVWLKDVQGGVSKDGKILLDLGDAVAQQGIWEVTGHPLEKQRRMAGAFFKRKFRNADPLKRTFSLGTLAQTSQEFMKPQSFRLRTVMEAGGNLLNAVNYGNGALEIRIAMDDELAGGWPGQDWLYPLPSDHPELNALMIVGSRFLMNKIIAKGVDKLFGAEGVGYDGALNSKGFVDAIRVKRAVSPISLRVPEFQVTDTKDNVLNFDGYYIRMYVDDADRLTVTLVAAPDGSSRLKLRVGTQDQGRAVSTKLNGQILHSFVAFTEMISDYIFSLDEVSGQLKIDLNFDSSIVTAERSPLAYPPAMRDYLYGNGPIKPGFGEGFKAHVTGKLMDMFNSLEAIDLFILNTLIFNSESSVRLKTLNLTGDMVLFGSLDPRLEAFSIDPVEILVGHAQSHPFKTKPVTSNVTWTVRNLDGSTQGAGTINSSGVYTAPLLSDIQGTYKRVRVIATKGGHTSRALVSVVARTITLNPLIEICNASSSTLPETRELSAHTVNGILNWRVVGGGSIPYTAGQEGKNVYTAPLVQVQPVESFTVDEVVVKNTTTQQEQSTLMVVKYRPQSLVIKQSFEGGAGSRVKLVAALNGQIPAVPVQWKCIPADAGEINAATGFFTASQTTTSQFALITAVLDLAGIKFDGFTILPLPLSPLPPKPLPEEDQVVIFDN
ncbi:hypothetical protein J3P96_07675 [Pseudomonas sp. R3-56]|uniref:hypothetical protein n=1 Tax=Pseudomonas sp. R3-56 TaxID=2817401 RepID=UPI003DA81A9B